MRIIQIVPRLPPAVDGLGDYAYHLAAELRRCAGWETVFIVGNPDSQHTEIDGFKVISLKKRSASKLLQAIESVELENGRVPNCVLLHYVNYAYAKRGCPFWLVNACESWAARPGRKLITVFHELFAVGPIWRSEFWLSRVQIHLAKRLRHISDGSVTSTHRYAKELLKWHPAKPITVLPVFSNIGEPRTLLPLAWRKRRAVVFGRGESRRRVYADSARLADLCRSLNIDEIYDIGPRLGLNCSQYNDVKIHELGELPGSEVSDCLLNSIAGIFDYAAGLWSKSGIFAAYCAHGVIPVSMQHAGNDGGITQDMYWLAGDGHFSGNADKRASKIAEAAHRWYREHNREACAERIAELTQTLYF